MVSLCYSWNPKLLGTTSDVVGFGRNSGSWKAAQFFAPFSQRIFEATGWKLAGIAGLNWTTPLTEFSWTRERTIWTGTFLPPSQQYQPGQAGIHAKAILNNPSTYEIINPADFGMTRYVHFASRLTGWNAIKSRAAQLNIEMTDEQYKECTAKIKALAGQNILISLTSPMLLYPTFPEH
jgi:hypothetical protein